MTTITAKTARRFMAFVAHWSQMSSEQRKATGKWAHARCRNGWRPTDRKLIVRVDWIRFQLTLLRVAMAYERKVLCFDTSREHRDCA